MSHYWVSPTARVQINRLAVMGTLCSSMVTMDEARFSARSKNDLAFVTELYRRKFFWLPFDEDVEQQVGSIRTALWKIGAGRGAQTTDLLVAATAVRHDAVVVHNDTDFLTVQRAVPELQQLRVVP
jgi:predicted nucleic acid-binding protein